MVTTGWKMILISLLPTNDGHIKSDKLYNVDYAKDASRSASSISTMTKTLYVPPTWWTKARAIAADKQ